jgi:hypothetical protein
VHVNKQVQIHKCERPAEIRKQIVAVYGNVMNWHLFLHLTKHLAGKKFDDDDEVQEEVMTWFKGQAADFCDSRLQKLVPRLYPLKHTAVCETAGLAKSVDTQPAVRRLRHRCLFLVIVAFCQ